MRPSGGTGKTDLKPWLQEQWCIPEVSPAYVAAMEDVLDLYAEPYDPTRPVVCFDERPCQLVAETRTPLPPGPGQPAIHDYEYRRNGTCNVFAVLEPHTGWRHIEVTERRTAVDFAHQLKALVDEDFPQAQVVRVVLDNLNTHTPASLYAAFPPAEARRLAKRLEFHHTPKHGSWLNMTEPEPSVLERQCLRRRLGDWAAMARAVTAWADRRNGATAWIDWQFTTSDARTRLRRRYPAFDA